MGFNPVEFLGGMMESGKDAMNERKETLDQIHKELEGLKKSLDKGEINNTKLNEKMGKLQTIFQKECKDKGVTDEKKIATLWFKINSEIETAILQKTPEFQDTLTFTNRLASLTGFKALTSPDAEPNVAKSWFDKINEKCKSAFAVSAVAIVKLLKEFEGLTGTGKDKDGNPKEGMFSKLYKRLFIYSGEHKTKFEEYKSGISLPEGFTLEGKYSKKDEVEMSIKNTKKNKVGTLKFNPSAEQITLILVDKDKTTYTATNAEEINEYLTEENLGATPAPAGDETLAKTKLEAEKQKNERNQKWKVAFGEMDLDTEKIEEDLDALKEYKPAIEEAGINQQIENATKTDGHFDKLVKAINAQDGISDFKVRLTDLYIQQNRAGQVPQMIKIIEKKGKDKPLKTATDIRNFLNKSNTDENFDKTIESYKV